MDGLHRDLALLTDAEARDTLNRIVAGAAAAQPDFERLVASPDDLSVVLNRVGDEVGLHVPAEIVNGRAGQQPKGTRLVLIAMADDPELSPRVAAALAIKRATLLEPVTSALVLAGITLLLSVHVDIHYENDGGEQKLRVHVEKKPTSTSVIKKFFGLFG
jgi:hypothetical protein